MNLRINSQPQPELLNDVNLRSGGAQQSENASGSSAKATQAAATQDTASISAASSQLTGEDSIRQERVAALRSQVESGTYTVDARAVATAMFQNLFRS